MRQPVLKTKDQFCMMGISVRTTNANEITVDAKIGGLWGRYYGQKISDGVPNPVNAPVTYGLYSDYEDGVHGEYDITAGLEVKDASECPEGVVVKSIPAATYLVFTSEEGPLTDVVITLWQEIWRWFEQHQEVERTYTGDFELYDARCENPQHAQVDIYIAIQA
ncbi:GyrI-like domain-containing protein [Sporosarcina sp. NPDC096371]|uniref:GyrI-like domain-containing protein n=1 Tax=Sporosarcina sp. NPDC096371 TaxID=3364530 RepID=UPI0037FF216F